MVTCITSYQSYRCYYAYVDQLQMTMVDSYEIAHDCLQKVVLRQKQLAEKILNSGWTGPHMAVKMLSDATNRLQVKPNGPIKVMHVDNLMIHNTEEDVPNWIIKRLNTNTKQVQTENELGSDDEVPDSTAIEQPKCHEVLR